jgi:hypothetical protein
MNLVDLYRRRECRLERELIAARGAIAEGGHRADGASMRGLSMPPGARILLPRFQRHDEFRHVLPRDLGWAVARQPSADKGGRAPALVVRAELADGAWAEVARVQPDGDRWYHLPCDWPVALMECPDAALLIEVTPADAGAPLFLGVAEAVNLRAPLIRAARGDGIEIGPGLRPQVLPGPDVTVRYLERSAIDEWLALYN